VFLGLEAPLPYDPPWLVSLETRRAWLEGGNLRIAYIYELEDTSTFRYRVFNMVEAFQAQPQHGITASWFTRREFHLDQSFVDHCDLIVICRTRYDEGVARLVERAHARGVKVLYDVDDLVFDLSYVHYIMDAIGVSTTDEENWDYWYSYIGRLEATLELCDGAIVSTPTLVDRIQVVRPGLPCSVIPNYLNRRQTELSTLVLERRRSAGCRRDGNVTFGFLSGSPSHIRDLELVSPAVAGLLSRHPDVRLQFVGFAELNEHLRPYASRIDRLPLQDYLNLQRVTAACEFCLVPLTDNLFTRCKSELKFFEAGIVECPIVASPIPSYRAVIADGVDGLLAASHQWHDKLEAAYTLVTEAGEEYRGLANAARRKSLERYAWDHQGPVIASAIRFLQEADAPLLAR
jgi:glycosyltransferase involved in cell wall biosynthesis